MYQSFCEKSRKNFTFFVLCLAWQNLILPLVRLALGHNYCLPNLNFHVYNIAHKPRKVKKNFQLFFCTIRLRLLLRSWHGICIDYFVTHWYSTSYAKTTGAVCPKYLILNSLCYSRVGLAERWI